MKGQGQRGDSIVIPVAGTLAIVARLRNQGSLKVLVAVPVPAGAYMGGTQNSKPVSIPSR